MTRERLDRWCRRTDAEGSLGTDGIVLAAEAALLQLDEARSASIIERAAGAPPPLLAHGADIGQRIASVLLAEIDEPDGESPSCVLSESQAARLRNIRKEFSRLLFVADAESSSLSIPTAKDPRATLDVSRFRYAIRWVRNWLATTWRRRYVLASEHRTQKSQYLVGAAVADTSVASQAGSNQANQQNGGGQNGQAAVGGSPSPAKLGGPALWTAVGALVAWIAFSIVLLFNISKNETEWTRIAWVFGSIQSVAFAAAGALFGTAVQQQNVSTAQQQAAAAKQDADQQRDAATKGRALGAVMQAEGATMPAGDESRLTAMAPDQADGAESADALRQRHALLSRSLFGNLVEPPHSS